MVGRSWRLLWWDLVSSGERPPVDDRHELVLGPSIFMVIESLPEWR
jgi:hypothetical protein